MCPEDSIEDRTGRPILYWEQLLIKVAGGTWKEKAQDGGFWTLRNSQVSSNDIKANKLLKKKKQLRD